MTRFVNEEEVPGVVEILADEFIGLEFELDTVVTLYLSRDITGPKVHSNLPRTNGQLRRLWRCLRLPVRSAARCSPAASKLIVRGRL